MEIRQYIRLFGRWAWLIILAVALGAGAGYLYSRYEKPVYRATSRILIMQPNNDNISNPFYLNDKQLTQTYTELIATGPVVNATSERLGYHVSNQQINVQQVPATDILQVTVEDNDPQRAADIANTVFDVFVEENEAVQASRYAAAEESLQTQIQDFEVRIAELQSQLTQLSEDSFNEQIENVTKTIADLQAEISVLQDEIVRLDYIVNPPASPIPGRISLAPTPSVDQQLELVKKQDRMNELKSLLAMYQRIYVDMTFAQGTPGSASAPASRKAEQVQAALNQYIQNYTNLLNNYESLRLARMQSTPNIVQIEAAVPPANPIRPRSLMNTILGAVVGLMLGGGFAFVKEYLDDTLRSPEEVAEVLQLPVLGYIGDMKGPRLENGRGKLPYVLAAPRSPVTEAFRSLRANLEFSDLDNPVKSLLITSSTLSEGKTTIAVNLAIVMAQLGRKVVLVDADLRRPRVHQVLGISNLAGLSDVLRKHATIQDVAHAWGNGNLIVITSGSLPPNPAEVLSSDKMVHIMNELKTIADIVIIDSPPFLLADASVLAARADGVLLVVQSNKTHLNAALSMMEQLNRVGARIIGVALNRINTKETYYYYEDLKNYSSYAYDIEKTQPGKKYP